MQDLSKRIIFSHTLNRIMALYKHRCDLDSNILSPISGELQSLLKILYLLKQADNGIRQIETPVSFQITYREKVKHNRGII